MSAEWVDNSTDLLFSGKAGQQHDRGSIEFLFKLANDNFKQRKYRMAVVYLKKILQIVPEENNAYKMLAKTYIKRRLYKKAANTLRQAIEVSYKDPELHYLLAKVYLLQGDHQQFLRESTKTLVVNENFAPAYNAMAMYYFSINDLTKARENVDKALNLSLEDLSSRILRGKILFKQQQYDQALEDFKFGLTYNSGSKELHNLLGECYFYLGAYQTSLDEFALAENYNELFFQAFERERQNLTDRIARDPSELMPKMDLASLYFTAVKYDEAKQLLTEIIKNNPTYLPAKINLGLLMVFEDKYYEAIKIYREVLEISPANKEAQANLARAYQLAEKYYKYRVSSPEDILKMSNIYLQQGIIDKAMLCQYEFKKRFPQNKSLLDILEQTALKSLQTAGKNHIDQYLIYQAYCLFVLNEITEAEYILNNLEAGKYAGREYLLGLISKKKGNIKEAFDYLESSRKLNADYWLVDNEVNSITNFELKRLEKQLQSDPKNEKLHEEYVQILILRGNFKTALSHLAKLKKAGISTPLLENKMEYIISTYENELEMKLEAESIAEQIYLDLCEIYLYKKRYFEAFSLIQEARKRFAGSKEINNYFQFILDKAIDIYQKIILDDDVESTIYYNLAILYAYKQKKEESLKALALACADNKKLALSARYEEAFQDYYSSETFRKAVVIDEDSEKHIDQWLD